MSDRNLLIGFLIHEDVVITLFIEILVGATLYADILKFLTDIEAAFQNTAIDNILKFNTHNGVTFSGFYMQEFDYEIQTTVHTDAHAVLNVL